MSSQWRWWPLTFDAAIGRQPHSPCNSAPLGADVYSQPLRVVDWLGGRAPGNEAVAR
jgi:hypothetical protein